MPKNKRDNKESDQKESETEYNLDDIALNKEFLERGTHEDFKKIVAAIFLSGKTRYYKCIVENLTKRLSNAKNKSVTMDLMVIFKKTTINHCPEGKSITSKILKLFTKESDIILNLLGKFESLITNEKNSSFKKLYLQEVLGIVVNLSSQATVRDQNLNNLFKRLLHIYLNRLRDGSINSKLVSDLNKKLLSNHSQNSFPIYITLQNCLHSKLIGTLSDIFTFGNDADNNSLFERNVNFFNTLKGVYEILLTNRNKQLETTNAEFYYKHFKFQEKMMECIYSSKKPFSDKTLKAINAVFAFILKLNYTCIKPFETKHATAIHLDDEHPLHLKQIFTGMNKFLLTGTSEQDSTEMTSNTVVLLVNLYIVVISYFYLPIYFASESIKESFCTEIIDNFLSFLNENESNSSLFLKNKKFKDLFYKVISITGNKKQITFIYDTDESINKDIQTKFLKTIRKIIDYCFFSRNKISEVFETLRVVMRIFMKLDMDSIDKSIKEYDLMVRSLIKYTKFYHPTISALAQVLYKIVDYDEGKITDRRNAKFEARSLVEKPFFDIEKEYSKKHFLELFEYKDETKKDGQSVISPKKIKLLSSEQVPHHLKFHYKYVKIRESKINKMESRRK
eukprot:GAHX01002097.1.p1 GENE.GAHX01002097.1~~GAHX01002097.1.p1  ORF type:complete len:635 (-),score=144.85 GAHX01002097.1:195-2057(-)